MDSSALTAIHSLSLTDVNLHALQSGWVKIKKSHFAPGLQKNLSLLDPQWTEWLPIYSWLIEKDGDLTLVDAGVHVEMEDLNYFKDGTIKGWVNSRIVRFQLKGFPGLPSLIESLGYSMQSIKRLVITHLHLDHVGGLGILPDLPVWLCSKENQSSLGVMDKSIPPDTSWKFPEWQEPSADIPFYYAALEGDPQILMIQTPGHSPGHQSVLIRTGEMHVLLAGDVTYTLDQLMDEEVPGISSNRVKTLETIRSIKLYAVKNNLLYLPSHDPGVPQRMAGKELLHFEH
jgi:glyoxylase-like metal-dependent hydrolase (beta-lactamase superfamily II)